MIRFYKTISFSAPESQDVSGVLSRAVLIHDGFNLCVVR